MDTICLAQGLNVVYIVSRNLWSCLKFKINFLEVEDGLMSLSLKHELAKFFLSTKIWKVAPLNMYQNTI